ncbi:MAG TPA: cupin domain-containing protein, partial [Burkholderiaceae bacterium]
MDDHRAGVVTAARSFGRVQRSRALPGMSVEEVLMPAGLSVAEHAHEDAQICCVLEGEYLERAGGRTWRLQPGVTWFRPAREQHSNRVSRDQDALTLLVSFERQRFAAWERPGARPCLLSSLLLGEFRSGLIDELRRGDAGVALAL